MSAAELSKERSSDRASERARRDSITVSVDAEAHLESLTVDESLMPGARNAINTALGLRAEDRMVLIVALPDERIGAAFLRAAQEARVITRTYVVDVSDTRSEHFVKRLELQLDDAKASILIGGSDSLAPEFRRRICLRKGRRRHAHMVGITAEMMRQSMRVDYGEVHALGERLRDRLKNAKRLTIVSGPHSRLIVDLASPPQWHNGSGFLRAPGFTNLPGGEVVACPANVDGQFHADGGIWLPHDERLRGLQLKIRGGRVIHAEGRRADAFLAALDADENGRRVGQAAFGTNVGVLTPIGAMLQDLKMPGFHIVLGYSCPQQTGADWTSTVMVPLLCRRPDVMVDGQPIMVRGRYARSII